MHHFQCAGHLLQVSSPYPSQVKNADGTVEQKPYTLVHYITPDGQPPGSLPDDCLVQFSEVCPTLPQKWPKIPLIGMRLAQKLGLGARTSVPYTASHAPRVPKLNPRLEFHQKGLEFECPTPIWRGAPFACTL